MMDRSLTAGTILGVMLLSGCALAATPPLFQADFQQDPLKAGWTPLGEYRERVDSQWVESPSGAGPADHCLLIKSGSCQSPAIGVTPFQYYSLQFKIMGEGRDYWAAQFNGADGRRLPADHYSCVYGTNKWTDAEFCFQGKAGAKDLYLLFRARAEGAPCEVDDVVLRPVTHADVGVWEDKQYAGMLPLNFAPSPERGKLLARSLEKLRAGGEFTIVMLGDSIVNDTGNSGWETLVERHYPKAQVKVITSVRGGGNCSYYRAPGMVQKNVLAFHPDLLIIGGISHGYDVEPIRDVIRQVRAESAPDILLLTGPVTPDDNLMHGLLRSGKTREQAQEVMAAFPGRLQQMAQEEKVEFFDMRAAWQSYVKLSAKPDDWFMRDDTHANERGRQLLARILERYFSPPDTVWPEKTPTP